MTVFQNLNDLIRRRRLARAAGRDIEAVLAACLPDDWPTAPPEPVAIIGCVHPFDQLRVNWLSMQVTCAACLTVLSKEEVGYRMDQR